MIPSNALKVIEKIEENGFRAYLVGGCVRDMIRQVTPHDWDITTDATPNQIIDIFAGYNVIETGLKHGTVTVMVEGEPIEITTFRSDNKYTDHRRPESVSFVTSLLEDLRRRDFTMNAIAYNPKTGFDDPYGGEADIKNGVIVAVGDPAQRFDEDALRIMRAMRFASVLGYGIEVETLDAMRQKAHLLGYVSVERIFSELKKMLVGENILNVLMSCGDILATILPEIKPMIGFEQKNRHHIYDVWEHTAHAVAHSENDVTLRIALLFHDIGKPHSFTLDSSGEGHFYGHAKISAELTEAVLRRLKCDNETLETVTWLVKMHDTQFECDVRTARRMISRFGYERCRLLLKLKMADNSAQSADFIERGEVAAELLKLIDEIESEAPCLTLHDLEVDGHDLMSLGLEGAQIGRTLGRVLEAVVDDEIPNEKEKIIEFIKSL